MTNTLHVRASTNIATASISVVYIMFESNSIQITLFIHQGEMIEIKRTRTAA